MIVSQIKYGFNDDEWVLVGKLKSFVTVEPRHVHKQTSFYRNNNRSERKYKNTETSERDLTRCLVCVHMPAARPRRAHSAHRFNESCLLFHNIDDQYLVLLRLPDTGHKNIH